MTQSAICANAAELPLPLADATVLATVEQEVLDPAVVEQAVKRTLELLKAEGGSTEAQREQLTVDLLKVEKELENLTTAIAAGGDLPFLVEQAKERERRRTALKERLAALDAAARTGALDCGEVQEELRARLKDWRGLLRRQVAQARQILRKLLHGRLAFTPGEDAEGRYFAFKGEAALGRVLEGVAHPTRQARPVPSLAQGVWSPWGHPI